MLFETRPIVDEIEEIDLQIPLWKGVKKVRGTAYFKIKVLYFTMDHNGMQCAFFRSNFSKNFCPDKGPQMLLCALQYTIIKVFFKWTITGDWLESFSKLSELNSRDKGLDIRDVSPTFLMLSSHPVVTLKKRCLMMRSNGLIFCRRKKNS